MTQAEKSWTGSVQEGSEIDISSIFEKLTQAFNTSPFFQHAGMTMRVVDGQIEAYIEMQDFMIGNVAYEILHGGVAATILDSIGGITAMGELYKKATLEEIAETSLKASRLATVDMRVDYLAPGRGKYFTARAETLRLGRKGCTMRMTLINDEAKPIATAIASYSY